MKYGAITGILAFSYLGRAFRAGACFAGMVKTRASLGSGKNWIIMLLKRRRPAAATDPIQGSRIERACCAFRGRLGVAVRGGDPCGDSRPPGVGDTGWDACRYVE